MCQRQTHYTPMCSAGCKTCSAPVPFYWDHLKFHVSTITSLEH